MSFNFVQNQPSTLSGAGNSIGDTTLVLTSLLAIDGTTHLTMSNFGAKGYATIEPGNGTQEEQISFTGITNNANGTDTLTGVSTVLFVTPYTETSGLAKTHPGGAQFVISNTAGFYNQFAIPGDNETITGVWTFNTVPVSGTDPTSSSQVANKHYVDTTAVAGAPNASTTTKGIVQEATQAQTDARTVSGSTGADLYLNPATMRSTLLSDFVADTGTFNAYVITPSPSVSSLSTGQVFSFKAANSNTGASTIVVGTAATVNLVNPAQGALLAGSIGTSQIVTFEYDGTNAQILNVTGNDVVDLVNAQTVGGLKTFSTLPQSAVTPLNNSDLTTKTYVDSKVLKGTGATTKDMLLNTTTTMAHGLGVSPTHIRITLGSALGGTGAAAPVWSHGTWNVSGQQCDYSGFDTNGNTWFSSQDTTHAVVYQRGATGSNVDISKGTVTVDSTNITITWAITNATSGTAGIIFEAFA